MTCSPPAEKPPRDGGLVVWLTGLPSSGKSTLARRVAAALRERGTSTLELDGDAVRAAMVPAHGYDDEGRAAFYETLARLAALAAAQGHVVLVPATASKSSFRARARALAPRFVEVFLDVPLQICTSRDAKGLYALDPRDLPGSGVVFERPIHPDLVVTGATDDVTRALECIAIALGTSVAT